jgi:transcription-repair coupling factor (superfamily II helicase)
VPGVWDNPATRLFRTNDQAPTMISPILLNPETVLPEATGEKVRWGKVYGCTAGLAIAELTQTLDQCILVLTTGVAEADSLSHQVEFFLDQQHGVALYPDLEALPYDAFSPHPDLIANRLKILRQLNDNGRITVLAAAAALLPCMPPPGYLQHRGISLQAGQQFDPGSFRQQLEDAGYQRVSQVSVSGDYAVRGSLIDFFPSGHDAAVRVDFFDDQIESLRTFDPDSQMTSGTITELDTLPAREIPIDSESVTAFRQRFRQRFEGNPTRSLIYREISERRLPGGIENYLPLFFDQTASIWEYLPANTLIVCCGDIETALDTAWKHANERYEQTRCDVERPALKPDELFFPAEHHIDQIGRRPSLRLETFEIPAETLPPGSINLPVSAPPGMLINRREPETTRNLRNFLKHRPARILFASESPGRREMLAEILQKEHIFASPVTSWPEFLLGSSDTVISVAPLDQGVILPNNGIAIITEQELFGEKPRRKRRHRRVQDPEALIGNLTDLLPGAPVVHAEYGVGRYVGLTNLDIDEMLTEFVTVEYAEGDRLHVPVSSLDLISRYTGSNPDHAPLHKLGSDQWAKARRKAAEKIRDVAAELLELYSKRAARAGYSYQLDPVDAEKFADGFPFAATDDQLQAIEDVSSDLNAADPMDRLVCGDVGFGKTEVALRAAFIAVANNRQVAVLVPTTLLAQQHYQTFVDRFADWPVNIEALSRFQSQKQSRQILDGMRAGTVDIVIGTHRLLQRNVVFKNLGLVIIDEEQRFGVRHKEKLKALRAEVDILTLTATPIPRTLNMALGGLRELSLIATPPESRLSIKTFVTEWNERIIREACLRELKRGGQVYFVHNHVKDIQEIADRVAQLIPEGKTEVAHGQMRERELEHIMDNFYHRRFHILVCTAIIESGLDVPSANTIIINRADRFGLAQLHQLRGRVGRSHHQAFAYMLAPRTMTPDAAKRLEAIEALEDLGAGFVLATHDLEIRGAGELLGEGQSGQIQEIGFSLYNEILSRTVTALRAGLEPDLEFEGDGGIEINLHVPALLPEDYLPDVHLRLVHYKRIASARTEQELQNLQIELIDRFGLLPEATRNLFKIAEIRLKAAPIGIRRLELSATGGLIEFSTKTSVDPAILVHLLESEPDRFRLDRQQRLRVTDELKPADKRFELAAQLVDQFLAAENIPSAA